MELSPGEVITYKDVGLEQERRKDAVGQGKNGETDMKRIILAALVGVLVK